MAYAVINKSGCTEEHHSFPFTFPFDFDEAPDITIEAGGSIFLHSIANRAGIFWASATTGYIIYGTEPSGNLVYRKTTDGGATWGSAVRISGVAEVCMYYDCWADWQTAGDSGTKIHIVWQDHDEHGIRYKYLDTSTDTISDLVSIEACQGTGQFHSQVTRSKFCTSITKTRGGNLAIAIRYTDTDSVLFSSFYTSPDGTNWTSKTVPWEDAEDYIQLYCGNEADSNDLWAAFWDRSADEISLKTYDDSGNSWGEQSIASSMADSGTYLQMDGQIRLSDGHLIFAAWDALGFAGTANLKVWDINGAGSITAKANVITDTQHYFLVSVFINQTSNDIYVTYAGGTAILSAVVILYKKSTDGGSAWGSQTAMQANAEDDERWISCGAVKAAWGGKFMPVWFNDDLDDLYCNVGNAISINPCIIVTPSPAQAIASVVAPTVLYGSTTATPEHIDSLAQVVQPNVRQGNIIYGPTAVDAIGKAVSPSVIGGSILLTPEFVSAIASVVNPVIVLSSMTITPTYIEAIGQVVAPIVSVAGVLYITPAAIDAIGGRVNPTVIHGSIAITPDALSAIGEVIAPNVRQSSIIFSPAFVKALGEVVAPTVIGGQLILEPESIEAIARGENPEVILASMTITPEFIEAIAGVVAPYVIQTWIGRKLRLVIVTSQYRKVNVTTCQKRKVNIVTGQKRKVRIITGA